MELGRSTQEIKVTPKSTRIGVLEQAGGLIPNDHFTVVGMPSRAWDSQKSFKGKDSSDDVDGANFRGQKRSNETISRPATPTRGLHRNSYGKESSLAYLRHTLVENRNGMIFAAVATTAEGYAERKVGLLMLADRQKHRKRRITVGADSPYDSKDFVQAALPCTPAIRSA